MKPPKGHTLVELLFCLLIAGILLSLAAPSFVSTVENSRQTEALNQLLGALHYARGVAVMERKVVGICAGHGVCADKPHWQGQILIFNDRNRNGKLDSDEELLRAFPLLNDLDLYWRGFRSTRYVQYLPDGTTLSTNGSFTLCRANVPMKVVVINVTGRVRTRTPSGNEGCNQAATRR
ncbi:Type II transport protein GspH [compost metagenome]